MGIGKTNTAPKRIERRSTIDEVFDRIKVGGGTSGGVLREIFRTKSASETIDQLKRLQKSDPKPSSNTLFVDFATIRERLARVQKMAQNPDAWIQTRAEQIHKAGKDKKTAIREAMAEWHKTIDNAKASRPMVVDTNIPGVTAEFTNTIDHHGPEFGRKDGGKIQKANATMQVVTRIEQALRNAGAKDIHRPTEEQIKKAMELLDVKEITTDNLADGAEAVWAIKNRELLMRHPEKRAQLRNLGNFVDVTAFGNRHDRNDPSALLGGALLRQYGDILKRYVQPKLKGIELLTTDRLDKLSPEEAQKAMAEAVDHVDRLLKLSETNPAALKKEADGFWKEVDEVKKVTASSDTIVHREKDAEGKTLVAVYDLSKLKNHNLFAQWIGIPDLQRPISPDAKLPVQITLSPTAPALKPKLQADGSPELGSDGKPVMAEVPRTTAIIAVPNGMKLGKREGLLTIQKALNEAEAQKAKELGVEKTAPWIGKETVLLPLPAAGGTLLTPREITKIVTDPAHGLFPGAGPAKTALIADARTILRVFSTPEKRREMEALAKIDGPMGELARANQTAIAALERLIADRRPTFEEMSRRALDSQVKAYEKAKQRFQDAFKPFLEKLAKHPEVANLDLGGRPFFQTRYASQTEFSGLSGPTDGKTHQIAEIDILAPDLGSRVGFEVSLRSTSQLEIKQQWGNEAVYVNAAGDKVAVNFRVGHEWPVYRTEGLPEGRRSEVKDWLDRRQATLESLSFRQQDALVQHLAHEKRWRPEEIQSLIGPEKMKGVMDSKVSKTEAPKGKRTVAMGKRK